MEAAQSLILLGDSDKTVEETTVRLTQRVAPFSEGSLHSDEIVKFYTGLPNMKVLKAVFGLVFEMDDSNGYMFTHPDFMA